MRVFEDGSREPQEMCSADQKEISTLEDILVINFIPTCSAMVRNGLVSELPDWYYLLPMGDWPFHVLNAQHGNIGYLNQVMGVYRVHSGGIWSGLSRVRTWQEEIRFLETIQAHLDSGYESVIRAAVSMRWDNMAEALVQRGVEYGATVETVDDKVFDDWPSGMPLPSKWKGQVLGRIYATLLFKARQVHTSPEVRYFWLRAIQYDPSWLRNPGVWSIGVEAFLGKRAADWLRQGVRKLGRRGDRVSPHLIQKQ
jgi:hypothetical protein